jgi:hypothetical protein
VENRTTAEIKVMAKLTEKFQITDCSLVCTYHCITVHCEVNGTGRSTGITLGKMVFMTTILT